MNPSSEGNAQGVNPTTVTVQAVQSDAVAPSFPALSLPVDPMAELANQVAQLAAATRELLAVNREQLELAKRGEQRAAEAHKNQREEAQKFLSDFKHLKGRVKPADQVIRQVLSRAVTDLLDHIDEHAEGLTENEFTQREMTDKFGPLLYHLWAISGTLQRLAPLDQPQPQPGGNNGGSGGGQNPPKPPGA